MMGGGDDDESPTNSDVDEEEEMAEDEVHQHPPSADDQTVDLPFWDLAEHPVKGRTGGGWEFCEIGSNPI